MNRTTGKMGSQVLADVITPVRPNKVRLQLPVRNPSPTRPTTSSSFINAQMEFITHLNTHSTPQTKLKLSPLKLLLPYRKKLNTLEAQRIMSVLEELKLKCEIILLILPHVMKNLDKYSEVLGSELTAVIRLHSGHLEGFRTLEKLYLEAGSSEKSTRASGSTTVMVPAETKKLDHGYISSTTARSRDTALEFLTTNLPATSTNKRKLKKDDQTPIVLSRSRSRSASDSYSSYLATLDDYTAADKELIVYRINRAKSGLEFSIRNVLRAFRNNEKVTLELLAEVSGRSRYKEGMYFLQCLNDLKDMLLERLLVSPEEQREKMQFLAQVSVLVLV